MLETQDGLVTGTIEWETLIPDIGCISESQNEIRQIWENR